MNNNLKWILIFIATMFFVIWMVSSDWYCEATLNGVYWNEGCWTKTTEGNRVFIPNISSQILDGR